MQRPTSGHTYALALAAGVWLLAGCGSPTEPQITSPGTPSAVIGGTTVTLEAFPYRDMQPGDSPDTWLIVVARLWVAAPPFPSNISVRAIAVTHNATRQHWSPGSVYERPGRPGVPYKDFFGGGGPKWPVDRTVDVRVTVVDSSGQTFILGQQGVPISAPI